MCRKGCLAHGHSHNWNLRQQARQSWTPALSVLHAPFQLPIELVLIYSMKNR